MTRLGTAASYETVEADTKRWQVFGFAWRPQGRSIA